MGVGAKGSLRAVASERPASRRRRFRLVVVLVVLVVGVATVSVVGGPRVENSVAHYVPPQDGRVQIRIRGYVVGRREVQKGVVAAEQGLKEKEMEMETREDDILRGKKSKHKYLNIRQKDRWKLTWRQKASWPCLASVPRESAYQKVDRKVLVAPSWPDP